MGGREGDRVRTSSSRVVHVVADDGARHARARARAARKWRSTPNTLVTREDVGVVPRAHLRPAAPTPRDVDVVQKRFGVAAEVSLEERLCDHYIGGAVDTVAAVVSVDRKRRTCLEFHCLFVRLFVEISLFVC
jgi:hypothetical protein